MGSCFVCTNLQILERASANCLHQAYSDNALEHDLLSSVDEVCELEPRHLRLCVFLLNLLEKAARLEIYHLPSPIKIFFQTGSIKCLSIVQPGIYSHVEEDLILCLVVGYNCTHVYHLCGIAE